MNREERERRVDSALNRALAQENVEPRDGFEERLLANLVAQPERRPWWRWIWVPALAAAVALVAIVVGLQALRRPVPVIETHSVKAPPEQPVVTAKSQAKPLPAVRRKVVRRVRPPVQFARVSAPLPKQDVFPTPVPPTQQERMLLGLIHRRPRQAQEIAAEQEAYRQTIQKYLESISAPAEPGTAQQMR